MINSRGICDEPYALALESPEMFVLQDLYTGLDTYFLRRGNYSDCEVENQGKEQVSFHDFFPKVGSILFLTKTEARMPGSVQIHTQMKKGV